MSLSSITNPKNVDLHISPSSPSRLGRWWRPLTSPLDTTIQVKSGLTSTHQSTLSLRKSINHPSLQWTMLGSTVPTTLTQRTTPSEWPRWTTSRKTTMSSPPGQQMSMLRHALTLSSITTLPEKIISGSSSRNQDLIWVTGHWPTDRRLHSKSSSPPSAPTIKVTISSTSLRLDNFFVPFLLVVPCNVYCGESFFFLLLKTIHPYEIYNNWLLATTKDDMKFTEKKSKKWKKFCGFKKMLYLCNGKRKQTHNQK